MRRSTPHILALSLLPALIGCHAAAPVEAPLTPRALAAIGANPGAPREALARRVDALFGAPAMIETRAVIVVYDGRIVAERYGPGYHENTRFISWSMAKSVTGVLIGLLVADGRLRLDQSPPIPAWQRPGDPRGEITLRQLLQMRSGLRHTEAGNPIYTSDEVRMLFLDGRDDMAAYAESQPLEAEPGRKWEYSSNTSVILADIAARVLTDSTDPLVRRQVVSDYLHTRLFDPLGMKSVVPEYDAHGTLIGGSLIHASARDWARFGEFLRGYGAVRGAQIVPRGWIEFMTSANPRNPGYGAQIWRNAVPAGGGKPQYPGAPASVFSCDGHLGQYIAVSPSQRLTVVRLGKTAEGALDPVRQGIADIIRLYPER